MKLLNDLCCLINRFFLFLGALSVLALSLIATANVVLRLFEIPYGGAYEIVSYLGAMITAFSLGYTQQKKDHIIVDFLSSRYPKPVKVFLDRVNYLLLGLFFSLVSWHLFKWALRLKASGELSENLQIPYYPFVMVVALGFASYSLTLFVDFFNKLSSKKDRPF